VDQRLTLEAVAEAKYGLEGVDDLPAAIGRARAIARLTSAKFGWADLGPRTRISGSQCAKEVFDFLYPDPYPDFFEKAGADSGIPYELLLAITRTESAFEPTAQSGAGALGLMQLLPQTAKKLGMNEKTGASLFDPALNISLGAKYLNELYGELGRQWHLAIASYNAGPNAVKQWLRRYPDASPTLFVELIPFPETRQYVKKVTEAYYLYHARKVPLP
jgi:soluble lytic murein transglycosylase